MTDATAAETPVQDKVTETAEKVGKQVENLVDKLAENQTRFAEAAATARDRSRRVTDEYMNSLAAAQRDALSLAKELAAHPTEFGKNMEAMLDSATQAQARAMEMTKLFYREQAEATSEFQKVMAPLFESTKGFGDLTKNFQSFMQKSA